MSLETHVRAALRGARTFFTSNFGKHTIIKMSKSQNFPLVPAPFCFLWLEMHTAKETYCGTYIGLFFECS